MMLERNRVHHIDVPGSFFTTIVVFLYLMDGITS